MAVFISIWHGLTFLKCGLAATAPGNDLEFFYDMLQLSALWSTPRPDTSPSYFKAGKLDAVPLLCSKKECVGSPLCCNETGGFYPRKTLASLVSVKSYLMFNLIGVDDLSWLNAPVALWNCFPSYVKAKQFVRHLLVVNDGAERGWIIEKNISYSYFVFS